MIPLSGADCDTFSAGRSGTRFGGGWEDAQLCYEVLVPVLLIFFFPINTFIRALPAFSHFP